MASVARSEPMAPRPTRAAQRSRREQVQGTLKEIEERQKKAKRLPLAVRISQAGLDLVETPVLSDRRRARLGGVCCRAGVRGRPVAGARRRLCRRLRPAVVAVVFPQEAARGAVSRRLSRCRRRHRSRHQGRPAAARQSEADRRRVGGADPRRIPRHHRDAGHRHAARRSLPQALRAHAGSRSEFLRHRRLHPAARRRQSVRGARQSVARAARPQEDEGEDPGHVDGSQGFRRRSSARCRWR